MINLKKINKNYNIFIFFFILYFFLFSKLISLENKIIFKINDKAFTTLDYEKRIQYLDFVGNNKI